MKRMVGLEPWLDMEDHAKDLIPPIDEWVIGTSAEQLIYMSPCNGLPLTREVSV